MDPLSLSLIIIFFGFCLELLGGISNLSSSLNLFFVGVRSDGGDIYLGGIGWGGQSGGGDFVFCEDCTWATACGFDMGSCNVFIISVWQLLPMQFLELWPVICP